MSTLFAAAKWSLRMLLGVWFWGVIRFWNFFLLRVLVDNKKWTMVPKTPLTTFVVPDSSLGIWLGLSYRCLIYIYMFWVKHWTWMRWNIIWKKGLYFYDTDISSASFVSRITLTTSCTLNIIELV